MSKKGTEFVDLEGLRSIRDQFLAAASVPAKLFNATRIHAAEGVDPHAADNGWEEFLGAIPLHGAYTYERRPWGVRDICYFGAGKRLVEYTGLAGVAWGFLARPFLTMAEFRGRPRFNRDTWTLSLYRIAGRVSNDLRVDLEGGHEYGRMEAEPWLMTVINSTTNDAKRERENLTAWRSRVEPRLGRKPCYVYGALSLDVFNASAVALTYLLDHASDLYGTKRQNVTLPFTHARDAVVAPASGPTCERITDAERTASPYNRLSGSLQEGMHNSNRDAFIYERACVVPFVPFKTIMGEVNRRAEKEGWGKIETVSGIRSRAKKYSNDNGLPEPPRRQNL